MKAAVIVTKCFEDYQIIRWHLMDMNISELLIPKKDHVYSLIKKYSEDNHTIPLRVLNLDVTKGLARNALSVSTLLENCDQLVVFWNGKHLGIADLIQQARKMGKEVSVVYSYPVSTFKFANAHV